MLMSLSRMTGMPVVWMDQHMGYVERAVMNVEKGEMDGLIVRRGMAGAKWVARGQIALIGESCVILLRRPVRMPDRLPDAPLRVFLSTGEWAGEVTDGIVNDSLSLCALEVSRGALARLMGRSRYARHFRANGGEAIVPSLLSWAQLLGQIGEEEKG